MLTIDERGRAVPIPDRAAIAEVESMGVDPSVMPSPARGLRILGWAGDSAACGWHRMRQPYIEMAKHGHYARIVQQSAGRVNMEGTFGLPSMPVDVIVGQRMVLPEMIPVWRALKQFGPLVHELDDDLFHIDERNLQAATLYRRGSVRDALRHTSQISDMLTVSTDPLKKIMAEECDIDPDKIVVVPNRIDGELLDIERPRRDRLTIGWAGGGSHDRDMEQLHKPLRKILDRNPDVDFHNIGHDFRRLVRRENMRYTPWAVDIPTYWRTIDFDIGVVPLAHTIFNQAKSGLKVLEQSALGIPVVAMDAPPYREAVVDGETGFIVNADWQWVKRIQQLIDDDGLRERMGKAGREYVRQHWSITDGWKPWEDAYRRVVRAR